MVDKCMFPFEYLKYTISNSVNKYSNPSQMLNEYCMGYLYMTSLIIWGLSGLLLNIPMCNTPIFETLLPILIVFNILFMFLFPMLNSIYISIRINEKKYIYDLQYSEFLLIKKKLDKNKLLDYIYSIFAKYLKEKNTKINKNSQFYKDTQFRLCNIVQHYYRPHELLKDFDSYVDYMNDLATLDKQKKIVPNDFGSKLTEEQFEILVNGINTTVKYFDEIITIEVLLDLLECENTKAVKCAKNTNVIWLFHCLEKNQIIRADWIDWIDKQRFKRSKTLGFQRKNSSIIYFSIN